MKCLFVYNPVSGKGAVAKKVDYIVQKLKERFGEVDVYATQKAGELQEKAASACGVYDVFVFAGGDGSFNEVVMGLGERENRPVLGYIPAGTVNDIARSAGIKRNIRGALKNIVEGGAYPLDVMKVNDRYAMYVVCSGGLTGCSYKAKQSVKKRLGKIAYALEVLKSDLVFDEYPVAFTRGSDMLETSAVMVMIMNGRSVASFKVNDGAALDDGKAEVLIVCDKAKKGEAKAHKHFRFIFSALKVFVNGFRRLKGTPGVFAYQASDFSVRVPQETVWNFDGEQGPTGNISVHMLPKHVHMIIPRPQKGKKSCLLHGADTQELPLS